jgi:ribosomal protein S27AE
MFGGGTVGKFMTGEKVKLLNLSCCPCGFPVLHDHIKLGAEYTIYPETIRNGFKYFCGGCGRTQNDVIVVDADQPSGGEPMPLPLVLFQVREETIQ